MFRESEVVGRLVITYKSGDDSQSIQLVRLRDFITLDKLVSSVNQPGAPTRKEIKAHIAYIEATYGPDNPELVEAGIDLERMKELAQTRRYLPVLSYRLEPDPLTGKPYLVGNRVHELDYEEFESVQLRDRQQVGVPA